MYRRDQGLVTPDLYYPTGGERQRSLRYQDYGNGTKRKSRRSRLGAGRESRICRMQGALVVSGLLCSLHSCLAFSLDAV